MHLVRDVTLIAGRNHHGNPIAAYGVCDKDIQLGPSLERCDSGVLANGYGVLAGGYNVMIARFDRALFAGNGPHVGFEYADPEAALKSGRLNFFHNYGAFPEPSILGAWIRQLDGTIPAVSLIVTPDDDLAAFYAGIIKEMRGSKRSPEYDAYVMTANETLDTCRGFSTHGLLDANANGHMPHIPIKRYPISGDSPHEIASSLYKHLGENAAAACAGVFNGFVWDMEVINRPAQQEAAA